MNSTAFYASLMLFAGLGIPLMAALNGGLGAQLKSPALAATILFSVGLAVSLIYLFMNEGIPASLYNEGTPTYLYLGGFFVMFYILSITWVAPKFGISNAVSFVLLGQLISMSIIDHFGLVGMPKYSFTIQRFVGLLLMMGGIMLVLSKRIQTS